MSQKTESIWTKDLTPGIVSFMTTDISPDFSSELWTKDITPHMIGTLAVFGLVISSAIATLGVTALGVNVEVAFAQQAATQTASVVMASNQPAPTAALAVVPPMPTASSTPMFCPQILHTVMRGDSDATSTADIAHLQQFLANHYGLQASSTISGYFGSTTQSYLERFQQEQGIPPAPSVGPMTRAAIAKLCGGPVMPPPPPPMGSTTPSMPMHHASTTMATSTPPTMPQHWERPNHPSSNRPVTPMPAAPVSYNNSSSNSASVLEAVDEIGDGYSKLIQASLSSIGL